MSSPWDTDWSKTLRCFSVPCGLAWVREGGSHPLSPAPPGLSTCPPSGPGRLRPAELCAGRTHTVSGGCPTQEAVGAPAVSHLWLRAPPTSADPARVRVTSRGRAQGPSARKTNEPAACSRPEPRAPRACRANPETHTAQGGPAVLASTDDAVSPWRAGEAHISKPVVMTSSRGGRLPFSFL